MPSNLNALLIAWALSLITVVGGLVLLEAVYTPAPKEQSAPETAQVEDPAPVDTADKSSADAASQQMDIAQQAPQQQATLNTPVQTSTGENNTQQPAVQQPSLPAPGQRIPQRTSQLCRHQRLPAECRLNLFLRSWKKPDKVSYRRWQRMAANLVMFTLQHSLLTETRRASRLS